MVTSNGKASEGLRYAYLALVVIIASAIGVWITGALSAVSTEVTYTCENGTLIVHVQDENYRAPASCNF